MPMVTIISSKEKYERKKTDEFLVESLLAGILYKNN